MDIEEFENIEKKLNEKYENIIYIHKRKRNGSKFITYVQNFNLNKEKSKKFLEIVKTKINSSGSYKVDKKEKDLSGEKVFIFNGDADL